MGDDIPFFCNWNEAKNFERWSERKHEPPFLSKNIYKSLMYPVRKPRVFLYDNI